MIRVTGLYRDMSDSEFDFDYYVNTHMPLVKRRLADFGMGEFEVERGSKPRMGKQPHTSVLCTSNSQP